MFVVISTVVMTLNTLPMVQAVDEEGNNTDNPNLAFLESICISWFTLEFLLRYSSSGNQLAIKNVISDLLLLLVNGGF